MEGGTSETHWRYWNRGHIRTPGAINVVFFKGGSVLYSPLLGDVHDRIGTESVEDIAGE